MINIKQVYMLVLSVFIASSVSAERYSVTEDSFGGVSAEPVEVKSSSETIKQKDVSTAEPNAEVEINTAVSADKAKLSQYDSSVSSSKIPVAGQSEQKKLESVSNIGQQESDVSDGTSPPQRKLSVFEKAYYESERKAKAEVLKNLTGNKNKQETLGSYDATDIDTINFVDGDILERTGAREEVEKAPYFITIDENGNPRNTFYDPVLVNEALDKQQNNKVEYTQATVYEKFSQDGSGEFDLPEGADPIAAMLLTSGEKEFDVYFETFTKQCCEHLPNIITPLVEMGRPRAYQLTNEDLYYRFSDGDSRFLLVSLPSEKNENYPLRIRTFIRTFKKLSINHGVFFPQIITLNAEKKPVRIMTGPLLKYQAETWSTHGYLEGVFQIDRSEEKDERYVLINTTRDVLRQSSVIDTKEPLEISHMSIGSFEIEAILEE
ncbi:MAG: hypothetical protein ACI84K_000691 [Pseudohongiellaceae bacterium]|jgi:hypothetical protein